MSSFIDAITMSLASALILVLVQPHPLQVRVYCPILSAVWGLLPLVAVNFPQYVPLLCVTIIYLTLLIRLEALHIAHTG